ncbi:hypothetical protein UlMin_006547 [Ulmus minor]
MGLLFCLSALLHLLLSIFLFNNVVTHSLSAFLQPSCHDGERAALLQFKQSFIINKYASSSDGAYPKVLGWKAEGNNSNCCSWDGVECDAKKGHVIGIDLSSSCLFGSISSNSTLFLLSHLKKLNLADNDFNHSPIPSAIGNFLRMTYLNLSYSVFQGQIPSEISHLSKLSSLDLSNNYDDYTGENLLVLKNPSLTSLVKNLTRLEMLKLGGISISSVVPNFLANFKRLTWLDLDDCGLQGEFPAKFFQLPNLQVLDLGNNNNLTVYFPEFHQPSPLKKLVLRYTNFSGSIPPSIKNLDSLQYLTIRGCNFSRGLPPALGKLTQLTYLNLAQSQFSGHIPSFLQNLTHLTILSLFENNLNGPIPSWLGKLSQLTILNLYENNLNGPIPSCLGKLSQLTTLNLYENNLNGPIPSWLGKLSQLHALDLEYNNLTGSTPPSLQNLTKLTEISLGGNHLTGPIPSWLGNLSQATAIFLFQNEFNGSVPHSLSKLMNLEALYLDHNNLGGTLKFDMFFDMSHLTYLDLSSNNLSLLFGGTNTNATLSKFKHVALCSCNLTEFPHFLRYQRKLKWLDLCENKIYGRVPKWMWNTSQETLMLMSLGNNFLTGFHQSTTILPWVNLRVMDLSSNMLEGPQPIPRPSTIHYDVSNNRLNGEISPLICNLSHLLVLDMSNNNFSGMIPHCLGNFSDSLSVLNLRNNSFNGIIPLSCTRASNLRMIDFSDNRFQGKLPQSLVTCRMLESLDLANNLLVDVFPSWLGSLLELKHLILKQNGFHGTIRKLETSFEFPKLRVIDLSCNSFTGELPSNMLNWSAMKDLNDFNSTYTKANVTIDFNDSYVPREYDYSFTIVNKGVERKYDKIQEALAVIDLSSNQFSGGIPEIIGNMKALRMLNLSNNMLTGCIPSSLGNLSVLESLDLSHNKLSGEIPQQLMQLTFIASFNVSHNSLSGPIPQGSQVDTWGNDSFKDNPGLCGNPLSKKCENSEALPPLPSTVDDEDDLWSLIIEDSWKFVLAGIISGLVVGVALGEILITKRQGWFVKIFRGSPLKRRGEIMRTH